MSKKLRIVFLGTPDFAVASLDALVKAGYTIVGVVTNSDKPAGRGNKIQESAVKQYALAHNLPLLQPDNLKSADFLSQLKALKADIQVVVAFRMLPEVVWNMPALGTINVHASLLPNYRGAAPINWAVINGEPETGITTFQLQHAIDTGHILCQNKIDIDQTDTAGTLHDKLMFLGATTLLETLALIESNSITPIHQESIPLPELKLAPKIFKETCKIDWHAQPQRIIQHIKGLSPYPTAYTELLLDTNELLYIKVFDAAFLPITHQLETGIICSDNKQYLHIAIADGYIALKDIQVTGKKRLAIAEFLRGFNLEKCNKVSC